MARVQCINPCSPCYGSYYCDNMGAVQVDIGNPTQAPGTNPNTTVQPGSANNNPTFLSGLTGIATRAFAGIAAQGELSAQQSIARATNTTSISGYASTSAWVLIVGIGLLIYFLVKGR